MLFSQISPIPLSQEGETKPHQEGKTKVPQEEAKTFGEADLKPLQKTMEGIVKE
jgi:hypothetical protein